ncbi:MAG: DMT family transporter [Rhodospirillales bacterium]|nr:DMT family transporter [Rhodospirillales bacterium]
MNDSTTRLDAAAWSMLLLLSVLWGGSFLYVKIALEELPPVTIVALRALFGGAFLFVILRLRGLTLSRDPALWKGFAVLALLNTVLPFILIAWGQREISAGLAAILNAATPLWTITLAHFLTDDERMDARRAAGVLIGFSGVVVLVGPEALAGIGSSVLAQLACVAATISYGFALVWARRFKGQDGTVLASGQFICAIPATMALSFAVDRPWTLPMPGTATMLSIFGLAFLSTAVAYLVYYRLMQRAGAGNASLVTMLIPPSAVLLGIAFLGERFEPLSVAGFALIAAGLAVVDGRVLGLFRR